MSFLDSATIYNGGSPMTLGGPPVSAQQGSGSVRVVYQLGQHPAHDAQVVLMGEPVPTVPDLIYIPVEGSEGLLHVAAWPA